MRVLHIFQTWKQSSPLRTRALALVGYGCAARASSTSRFQRRCSVMLS